MLLSGMAKYKKVDKKGKRINHELFLFKVRRGPITFDGKTSNRINFAVLNATSKVFLFLTLTGHLRVPMKVLGYGITQKIRRYVY